MSPNNARRKPKKFTGQAPQSRDLVFSTKWHNLVEFHDERGKPYRRFYKLETLTSAIDKLVREQDRFLVPTIQKVLGSHSRLTSIVFELVEEDALRYIFQVRGTNAQKKRANVRLVVAKNQEEATRRLTTEFKHLTALYKQIPDGMVQPLRSGALFLPDRYRRDEHHRDIGAYITSAPARFERLGIHRNTQYMSLGDAPHTFSKKETEALKQAMVTLIASAFNPVTRDGLDTHQIDPSTFQVTRPTRGLPKIKVFNCVHMQTKLSPPRLLGFLLTDTWESRGVRSLIAPDDPRHFFKALVEAVGKETAKEWVARFAPLAAADKVKAPKDGYVQELAEIAAE